MFGQTRTITLNESGTLSCVYSPDDRKREIDLILQGEIDQRDLQYIRDSLFIGILDLSKSSIRAYEEHPAHTFPQTNCSGNTVDEYIAQARRCGVRKLILPDGIIALEGESCMGFNLSEGIVLPSSLKKIGKGAFSFTCLKRMEVSRNVEIIEEEAFAFSTLKELRFESNSKLRQLGDPKRQAPLFQPDDSIQCVDLSNCGELTKAVLPLAFHCKQLVRLILPESIIEISEDFVLSDNLKEVVIYVKTPPHIKVRWGKPTILVPKGCKAVYEQAKSWKVFVVKEM